jgi:MFS family permease
MVESAAVAAAKPTGARRGVLSTVCGAHFLHDGLSDSLYVLLPIWAQAFGFSYAEVGALRTAFSFSLAAFQMPAGLLAERVGERLPLAAGTVLAGAAVALFSLAEGHFSLLCLVLLAGLGSAMQHPLASSLVSKAALPGERRSLLGVYNFAGDLGKMTVAFLMGIAAAAIGWRAASIGYGLAVGAAGVAVYAVLLALGAGGRCVREASVEPPGPTAVLSDWGITNRRGFRCLSSIQVLDCVCRTGFLVFLPFLLLEKEASTGIIGVALALVFAGGAAGKLVCGLMAERLGVLRTVAVTEGLTATLIIVVACAPLAAAIAALPALGIALNGTSSVLYGTVAEFVREDRQARAFGLFYTLGSAANTIGPVALGVIGDRAGLAAVAVVLAALAAFTLPVAWRLGIAMQEQVA